ncbi:hypothetical protein L2E82_47530 [Cichorium intybus]|uniref:Uncharacterized protein n=1 Tax=Cichorium intybus TaxID=13427 RepID=A0ACB8YW18_CICIN|nr:hypothetical protein L2E82_47530 [Cichorium intybus]
MALSTISHGYAPADTSNGSDDSPIYQLLLDRCRSLETSYANLQEQFNMLEKEHTSSNNHGNLLHEEVIPSRPGMLPFSGWKNVPDVLPVGFSYKRALDQLGHAVYVSKAITRTIIYWNRSAEKLFGYEDYEALGQTVTDLLIYDEFQMSSEKILARVRSGQNWAGQFPFRKRSGETFMALVNKSPLYEDGELVGIVTVASGGQSRHSRDTSVDMEGNIPDIEKPPKAPPTKRSFSFNLFKKTPGGETGEDEFPEPSNYAARVFSKLNIQRSSNIQQESSSRISESHNAVNLSNEENGFSFEQNNGYEVAKPVDHMAISTFQYTRKELEVENDLNSVDDCEIRWEDLIFKEEIGHGSFARVYRGIWNGSDVAVKVYFGNQYSEKALQDYNKEIDIMKRLRHPNVLLFMGSVCSQDKLAMVTELLPRGSLFNVLHNSGHSLDIKRRLRMAADVARGMNYLHHRNPPIVHRDLKSSNLLVDKNWSVKVGDFGLSKLKHATFLTARSGRGTPQWMAPEVLRNEPSNEKSDVFSFGIILWELVTQCIPWSNMNPLQVVGVVGFMDRRLDLPENIDPSLSSIIQDCWQR